MIIRTTTNKDKFNFLHVEDMKPTLEKAKFIRDNSTTNGWSADRSIRHVGDIPNLLFHEYCKKYPELIEGTKEDQHRIIRKIFAEHPGLRTSTGNI